MKTLHSLSASRTLGIVMLLIHLLEDVLISSTVYGNGRCWIVADHNMNVIGHSIYRQRLRLVAEDEFLRCKRHKSFSRIF